MINTNRVTKYFQNSDLEIDEAKNQHKLLKELIRNLQKTEKAFKEDMVTKGFATVSTQEVDGYTVKAFTKKIFTFK
jgi:hypothetical protein|tara:strand:+ start:272 stop:499 length:228 start_codon:yes stop_codon:yes gene_type:complete